MPVKVPFKDGLIGVACPHCGWDNDGALTLVDRYATDFPPGPRGSNPRSWYELYRDEWMDPDDRVSECDQCGAELDEDNVVLPFTPVARAGSWHFAPVYLALSVAMAFVGGLEAGAGQAFFAVLSLGWACVAAAGVLWETRGHD